MKLRLSSLDLHLQKSRESIEFGDITYFYGQMGAGKSSIARLVDYCLGGRLDYSPALQSEFVSARLSMETPAGPLSIFRDRDSNQVTLAGTFAGEELEIVVPARDAAGELLPGTGLETLSDFLFNTCGIEPPRVRRSKMRDDSERQRLSFRDLFWYCYLDQDNIDSSFFHLDSDANAFQRLKSRDVMRYVLGFHHEQVADLELTLETLRNRRTALVASAESLRAALTAAGVGDHEDVEHRLTQLRERITEMNTEIDTARATADVENPRHGLDLLRSRARELSSELVAIETAHSEISSLIEEDKRHANEVQMLRVKVKRSQSAQAVLEGVNFVVCPRCTQSLPERPQGSCSVCGQSEDADVSQDFSSLSADVSARRKELEDSIARHEDQLSRMARRRDELREEKQRIDREISRQSTGYDSSYLTLVLALEKERSALEQQVTDLERLSALPESVDRNLREAADIAGQLETVRRELQTARQKAERDRSNLVRLEDVFLDFLLRSGIPGIAAGDKVSISLLNFLPEVEHEESGDIATTSFATTSSGGKKTLFKACFALAIHRVAAEIGANLPEILIIDTPMKNISERENRDQFERFHKLLYELAAGSDFPTQLVLIDKEFFPPDDDSTPVLARYMTLDDEEHPPLIPYYTGP